MGNYLGSVRGAQIKLKKNGRVRTQDKPPRRWQAVPPIVGSALRVAAVVGRTKLNYGFVYLTPIAAPPSGCCTTSKRMLLFLHVRRARAAAQSHNFTWKTTKGRS